jgi:hypothetical protein
MAAAEHARLVFKRASDQLVYRFNKSTAMFNDRPKWAREDKNEIVVIWDAKWGWIVAIEDSDTQPMLVSVPWNVHKEEQDEYPPEGPWVSKLGEKSYVYHLSFEDV